MVKGKVAHADASGERVSEAADSGCNFFISEGSGSKLLDGAGPCRVKKRSSRRILRLSLPQRHCGRHRWHRNMAEHAPPRYHLIVDL